MNIQELLKRVTVREQSEGKRLGRKEISTKFKIAEGLARNVRFLLDHIDDYKEMIGAVKVEQEFSENLRTITTTSAHITSEEDAIEYHNIDLKKWKVDDCKTKTWEVTMGGDKTGTGRPETYTNHAVALRLKRRTAADQTPEERAKEYGKFLKRYKPVHKKINIIRSMDGGLLRVDFADQHIDQLSWAPEAGDNWDTKISAHSLIEGTEYFTSKAKQIKASRILYPAGNDFFNADAGNATTRGTPQDVDVRYPKSFDLGIELLIRSIDRLAQVAPVDVVIIRGNHDTDKMFYAGIVLKHHYANSKRVTIDYRPGFRKYYVWESNLIGQSHGDKENLAEIPAIMSMEASESWGITKNRFFFHGHYHHEKKLIKEIQDVKAVHVEFSPSLAALQSWSGPKGLGAVRKSKAQYFHPKYGNKEDYRYFFEECVV